MKQYNGFLGFHRLHLHNKTGPRGPRSLPTPRGWFYKPFTSDLWDRWHIDRRRLLNVAAELVHLKLLGAGVTGVNDG